jgi:hypothetical protein
MFYYIIKKVMKKFLPLLLVLGIFLSVWVEGYTYKELNSANSLAKKGIIKSHSSNPSLYNLNKPVLRQEIALISRRVSGVSESKNCKNLFNDVTSKKPNNWICKNGTGWTQTYFRKQII